MSHSSIVIIQGTVGLYTVATRCHTFFAVTLKYTEDSSLTIIRHSLICSSNQSHCINFFTTSGIPGGYRLVSTYNLPHFSKWGGYSGVNFGYLKSEVFQNGGGYSGVNFGHLKSEDFQNGGGGFLVWNSRNFWKIENLDKNLLFSQKPACASQIVSHILRMWRLISSVFCNPYM